MDCQISLQSHHDAATAGDDEDDKDKKNRKKEADKQRSYSG